MLLRVCPCIDICFKERGKTVDRKSVKTALKPTCRVAWRLAAAVAAVFFSLMVSASTASADTTATTSLTNRIVCTTAPSNTEGNSARVFVSGNFVYVLEQYNHRVAVYDLVGKTNLFYYGAFGANNLNNNAGTNYVNSSKWAYGKGNGGFTRPLGMALDTFTGQNRFAVADTGNNRVQLFTFDSATGEITFAAVSETVFSVPNAVAFTEAGDILVADTGNKRVVRLAGTSLEVADTYALGENAFPRGICSDSDTSEGFWITDARNQRVAYYRIADGTDTPVVSFGTTSDKEFVTPHDVQILGDSDNGKFLCVVDNQGSRLRIMEAVISGGAYSEVVPAGDVGSYSDASLQDYEKLWRPKGVFVDPDSGVVYVANTGRNLIQWYDVSPESPEPPEPPKYFRVTSVTFYDTNDVAKTEFEVGEPVRLEIGYETDDEIDVAGFYGSLDGDEFVTKTLEDVNGVLKCDNAGLTAYAGDIDILLEVYGAEATFTTNFLAALTVINPTPPTEEYEEAGWHIDTFAVADGTATLTWAMPTNALPSDGKCDFRIEWRTSLTEGAWSVAADSFVVAGVTSAAGCTKDVSLSGISNPSAAFFRLFWTNKVKGVDP